MVEAGMATRTVTAAPSAFEHRLETLREADPVDARDQVWAWFVEAGQRFHDDRDGAGEELAALFRAGTPPRDIDGPTRGILVTPTVHPAFDRISAAMADLWLPWMGKRFDARAQRGVNRLRPSARGPARVLWPRYRMQEEPDGLAGFEFETRVEPGWLDPDVDVLVIDYEPVASNPRFVIARIRDELVEVTPGANLGKVLWRHGIGERHSLLGYFALQTEPPRD
jgi:hypothetical protein